MDVIDARLQVILNNMAERYAGELFQRAKNILSNATYRVTDELLNSVKVVWLKATESQGPRILFIFAEHGIFLDQRSPKWVKISNINKLIEWVEAKGIDKFKSIPGYKYGGSNLSADKKIKRVAFAIAMDKRKNDTWKRKRWKRDVLRDMLLRMNLELNEAFAIEVEKIIADSITGKLTL